MRCMEVLHNHIKKSCVDIHKTRLNTLLAAARGVIEGKTLTLSGMARHLESNTTRKHDIKRMDRLIGSPFLMKDKEELCRSLIEKILPKRACYLAIIVDESILDSRNERKLLRFSLALEGRSFTLYEVAYKNGMFRDKALDFLLSLKNVIPNTHSVIIISDAGFFPEWFKKINRLPNWYWLGRISNDYCYQMQDDTWNRTLDLYSQATSKPTRVGKIILTKAQKLNANLYLYKEPPKGRKKYNKLGNPDKTKTSIEKRKAATDPWLLATSLPFNEVFNAEKIISLYKLRMQIELQFRDLKSSRYGFCFEQSLTKDITRINNLLFIGYVAMTAVWLTGFVGEVKNLQYSYQSNTNRSRRVLSLLFLGHELCRKRTPFISKKEFQEIFDLLSVFIEQYLEVNQLVQI